MVLPQGISPLPPHNNEPTRLSADYQVTDSDVVCGRGRANCNRTGNQRFRRIVRQFVPHYIKAALRVEKAAVLSTIVDVIREGNHNGDPQDCGGRFVKQDRNGTWWELGELSCREKAGHVIREAVAQEQAKQQEQPPQQQVNENESNSSRNKQEQPPQQQVNENESNSSRNKRDATCLDSLAQAAAATVVTQVSPKRRKVVAHPDYRPERATTTIQTERVAAPEPELPVPSWRSSNFGCNQCLPLESSSSFSSCSRTTTTTVLGSHFQSFRTTPQPQPRQDLWGLDWSELEPTPFRDCWSTPIPNDAFANHQDDDIDDEDDDDILFDKLLASLPPPYPHELVDCGSL